MNRKFTACAKVRGKWIFSAEHDTREAAAAELFNLHPQLRACSVGYGYHGSFDIRVLSR